MFDKIKKLFTSNDNTDTVENAENVETTESKNFFETLFEKVLEAQAQDKRLPFKIFYLKEDELTVKVSGLFAHLPIHLMPWHYPHKSYWERIFPTLAGREFKCKITEASQVEDQPFNIHVDASAQTFRKVELIDNAEYTGIVLDKTEDEALIDIGSHFRWKYGSLRGFLPLSELANPESFQACTPGETIKVKYSGADDKGLVFANADSVDLSEYVGQTVWVQVSKGENTAPYFLVKGKYKADLPINKLIYPTNKKKVQKLRNNQWVNGDIINCEVLEFKPNRGLIIKWIDDSPEEIDWSSDKMIDYIGREVDVHVYVSDDDKLLFLVENKYPATLSARNRSNKKNDLAEGDVITGRICSIDLNGECFKIRWLPNTKTANPE
ncbi:hypothetical protein FACS189437_07420 [Bacteroidia bacterium]|nr:hypothetical protein FACS189437_07420 [Bacteroidia bacterium]